MFHHSVQNNKLDILFLHFRYCTEKYTTNKIGKIKKVHRDEFRLFSFRITSALSCYPGLPCSMTKISHLSSQKREWRLTKPTFSSPITLLFSFFWYFKRFTRFTSNEIVTYFPFFCRILNELFKNIRTKALMIPTFWSIIWIGIL